MTQHIGQSAYRAALVAPTDVATFLSPVPGNLIEVAVKLKGGINPNGVTNFRVRVEGVDVGTVSIPANSSQGILTLTSPAARFAEVRIDATLVPVGGLLAPIYVFATFEDSQGLIKRSSVVYVTPALLTGATNSTVIQIGRAFAAYRLQTSVACRVRLYTKTAYRDADALRPFGTPPVGEHGVILDEETSVGNLTLDFSNAIVGANLEAIVTDGIAALITNLSGGTTPVTVTLTRAVIEGAGAGGAFLLAVEDEGDTSVEVNRIIVAEGDVELIDPSTARIRTAGDALVTVSDIADVPVAGVARTIFVAPGDLEVLAEPPNAVRIKTASDVVVGVGVQDESGVTLLAKATNIVVADGDLEDIGGGNVRIKTASDVIISTDAETVQGKAPGAASGLATLGVDSKLLVAQLPAIALVERRSAANQAAMLALTDVQPGDFAFRIDTSEVYLLVGNDPSILANWVIWLHPAMPTTLPPSGAAGGDLGGNYPNPTVEKLQGATLPVASAHGFLKRNAAGTGWEHVTYGVVANTVAQGNDGRFTDSRTPSGAAGGDLGGAYPNPTAEGLQGNDIPNNSAHGFLKRNAANNGWEFVTYGVAANTIAQGNDARLSDSRAPSGAAGGDLGGIFPNPSVAALNGRSLSGIPTPGAVIADDFNDNIFNAALWVKAGTTDSIEQNGRFELRNGVWMAYISNFNFTDKWISWKMSQNMTGRLTFLPTVNDNWVAHEISGGLIKTLKRQSGSTTSIVANSSYVSATHVYFKIEHKSSDGLFHFYYSPTGVDGTWVERATQAPANSVASMTMYFWGLSSSFEYIDNVNSNILAVDAISGKNLWGLLWDNANNRFSILRTLSMLAYNPSGSPPSGVPSDLPAGHTYMVYEGGATKKLWVYNVTSGAWDFQQF